LGVLLVGLAYVWKKGDLDWIRTLEGAEPAGASLPVKKSRAGEQLSEHP
jgi:NADH-quinone oxidoreductase subunit A